MRVPRNIESSRKVMDAIESKVRTLIRPEVIALSAYHVQDASGLIKLDAMENPYHWPPDMVEDWLEVLREAQPNRYPDPHANRLRTLLRAVNDVPADTEIMLGNGSDELIQIVLMAIGEHTETTVLAPEPTFVMYRQIAATLGLRFVGVPLHEADFSLDLEAMRDAIGIHRPAVIFLAYPNNPTGNAFPVDDVLEILRLAPGLVVIDEAYAPFADDSFMARLPEFPHLLVMRTLSKLGLAGLRLGYLVGHPAWIKQLDKLRLPYNINVLTQLTAEFALKRPAVLRRQVEDIRRDRALMAKALRELPGITVYPSQANFITFRLLKRDADRTFQRLKQNGVLIKNLNPVGGTLCGCLRVTIGTPWENIRFLDALKDILTG